MSKTPKFHSQECSNPACRFRFPALMGRESVHQCPQCSAPFDETQTASYGRHRIAHRFAAPAFSLHLLLDNLRSAYNVGSIFRTAAAVGVQKLHLCGITATPPHPRLAKTALGTEKSISWDYAKNALPAADKLIADGFSLWALEGGRNAHSLFDVDPPKADAKLGLVLGNEQAGVDPALLSRCERILYLPMLGGKESLNVTVAFGVAAYTLLRY